jgi:hypothetical protein
MLHVNHSRSGTANDDTVAWWENYQVIECQGCNTISFRSVFGDDDFTPDDGPNERLEIYPDPHGREQLEDIALVPISLSAIYSETLHALDAGLPILAAIGIRAIVETVCQQKQATGRNLLDKINSLVSLGVLTQQGADVLHKLRTLGNQAAHEVKAHSSDQLNLAMRVVEHLLQAVYILPHHANRTFT